ncbi:unnamed protein product [Tenebrio molitor]|nr:unnamed protein product [Tenebrio molitor]
MRKNIEPYHTMAITPIRRLCNLKNRLDIIISHPAYSFASNFQLPGMVFDVFMQVRRS